MQYYAAKNTSVPPKTVMFDVNSEAVVSISCYVICSKINL